MNTLTPQSQDTVIHFVLLCLRSRFDPESLTSARCFATREVLDWDELEQQLKQEYLAPLIYSIVCGQGLTPPPLEQQLQQTYLYNAMRNSLLFEELSQVLRCMEEAGIPVIVLKGAALAEVVYGDINVRPMVDLDILVRSEHITRSLHILTALGYIPLGPEMRPGMTASYGFEIVLRKSGPDDVVLELHWRLLSLPHYQRTLQMDWFWQTATPTHFGSTQTLVLGPEAQLLHLCAHMMLHHRGKGILRLHDVAEVLYHYQTELDWNQVLNRVQAFDLVLSLQKILPQVVEQWAAPVPDDVLLELNALQPSTTEEKVLAWLTSDKWSTTHHFIAHLAGIPDWRRRLQFAWWSIFPSPDYMRHLYEIQHPILLLLSYPYRWFLVTRSLFYR